MRTCIKAWGERGGSVVECRTPEREVRGSRPTSAVLCPWARHFTPRKYWLITQEAMAPSRHDWKIVDWDVKPQHNQIKAWMSLNLGQIPPLTMELAALERLKYWRHHFFSFAIDPILFKVAGNEDMHNILDEFEFRPDLTTDYGVSCPWASEKIPIDL